MKRHISVLLLLCLTFALFSGCNVHGQPESTEPVHENSDETAAPAETVQATEGQPPESFLPPTEATDPPKPTEAEPAELCALYLQTLRENQDNERARFFLIYIDHDDVPELVIVPDSFHFAAAYIYSIHNEAVVDLGPYGTYGGFLYGPRTGWIIHYEPQYCNLYKPFQLVDGSVKALAELMEGPENPFGDDTMTWRVGDARVSAEVYRSKLLDFFGDSLYYVDNHDGWDITDTNIAKFQSDPLAFCAQGALMRSTAVELSRNRFTLTEQGETCYLDLVGDAQAHGNVFWRSSNPDVATVDVDGIVTAQSVGTAVITAYRGGSLDSCTIECSGDSFYPGDPIWTLSIPSDATSCTDEWGLTTHYFYVYSMPSDASWADAEAYCESLGGHLATLTDMDQSYAAYYAACQTGYIASVYFGLSDNAEEGRWTWVTGEPFQWSFWHSGEPNGGTGENYGNFYFGYDDSWYWNDGDYNQEQIRLVICEWDVGTDGY